MINKWNMRIENKKEHLVIRTAVTEDAPVLTKWWNDGTVMAHAGFPYGLNQTVEETERQIANPTVLSQRCIIEADHVKIGEMSYEIEKYDIEENGLASAQERGKNAAIGIKICEKRCQNQGVGTKLLQMFIEFLFYNEDINDKIPVKKIILSTNLNNIRAQHVYEKIGFQKIAVDYNSWKDQLGNLQSSVDYELTRAQYENGVRYIADADLKEQIAASVLADLPEWFGLPESTKEYIEKSRDMPFFAYYRENRYIGFIALKETSPYTAEIYVMGVLKKYHRQKVGETLFQRFLNYVGQKGYEFIQVKTVEEGHYKEYDQTRLFYERMGLKKLECFPTLWDARNPCLVMVMAVPSLENHTQSL